MQAADVKAVQLRMKEARAQLNTALLTNATLADKLSKAEAVNAALKEQAERAVGEREDACREVDACQATIRELRYRLMQNQRETAQVKSAAQVASETNNQSLADFQRRAETAEAALAQLKVVTKAKCDDLDSFVLSLERHVAHGFHAGPSITTRELIGAMQKATSAIRNAGQLRRSKSRGRSRSTSPSRVGAQKREGKSMDSRVQVFRPDSVLVSGDDDGASHALAETMGTICDELEAENGKLRSELQSVESELRATRHALRIAERSAALIPQYRAAVVKAKSYAVAMRHRAMEASESTRALQKELDTANERCEVAETNMVIATAKVEALEQNNRALREHVRMVSDTVRREDEFATTMGHDDVVIGDVFDIGEGLRQKSFTVSSTAVNTAQQGTKRSDSVGATRPTATRRDMSSTASVASVASSQPPSPGDRHVDTQAMGADAGIDVASHVERVSIARSNQVVAVSASTPTRTTAAPDSRELAAPYFRPSVSMPPPGTPDNIRAIRKGISSLDADIAALEQWLDRAADATVWTGPELTTSPQ